MTCFLGIDGGGSRTRAVIADRCGRILGRGEGGASNYTEAGMATAEQGLRQAVDAALVLVDSAGVELGAVFLGMAGVTCARDRAAVGRLWSALDIPVRCAPGIDHDIRIALSGGLGGRAGIALIAGTGSSCYGRSEAGRSYQCGGWGSLADDVGSGGWLGRRALEEAVRQADGRRPRTELKERVFGWLGLAADDEFMHRVHAVGLPRSELAQLAREVLALEGAGDPAAAELIEAGIHGLVELVTVTAAALQLNPAPVILAGGLMEHPRYRARLEAALVASVPGVDVREPELSPVCGAVMEAMRLGGVTVDAAVLQNLGE